MIIHDKVYLSKMNGTEIREEHRGFNNIIKGRRLFKREAAFTSKQLCRSYQMRRSHRSTLSCISNPLTEPWLENMETESRQPKPKTNAKLT